MKRDKSLIITLIIILLTVSVSIAYAESPAGNIKDLKGTAKIFRNKEWIEAKRDKPLYKDDIVRTFEKSRIKMIFVDDSMLMLGENSAVSVADFMKQPGKKDSSVYKLTEGVVNIIVGKRAFEVHTSTSVSAARGTSFLVWVEPGAEQKTGLAVTEGRVDFSNAQDPLSLDVIPAGRESYISKDKPPTAPARFKQDLIDRYYEQTLELRERWGPVILSAKGSGVPPPNAVNPVQARLLAERAAKVDALRNLAEQASGVRIVGNTTISDYITKSDVIKSQVDTFVKGAWVVSSRQLEDGTVEVEMELGLGIGFRRMFLEAEGQK